MLAEMEKGIEALAKGVSKTVKGGEAANGKGYCGDDGNRRLKMALRYAVEVKGFCEKKRAGLLIIRGDVSSRQLGGFGQGRKSL